MELIHKNTEKVIISRCLTEDEADAITDVFGRRFSTPEILETAQSILQEMKNNKLWLTCSCDSGEKKALMTACLRDDTQVMYLKNFRHVHNEICPLFRLRDDTDEHHAGGSRKNHGSLHISYKSFLPADDSKAQVAAPGNNPDPVENKHTRKRLPALARLLLSVLEDAKLHQVVLPLPADRGVRGQAIKSVARVLEEQEFARGRKLTEIIQVKPWMSPAQQEMLMQELEKGAWPAGRAHAFYQIFMTDSLTEEEAVFRFDDKKDKGWRFRPTRRFSINGEAGEGRRPPYWVIVMFMRNPITGQVECREGYAHALYEYSCPVPVDSQLERDTLKAICDSHGWVRKKYPDTAPSVLLEKPLFDEQVRDGETGEEGYVIPDFLLMVTEKNGAETRLVVETMGYTDDVYTQRKHIQHQAMAALGRVLTDPPHWPHHTEQGFRNYLYRFLLPAAERVR